MRADMAKVLVERPRVRRPPRGRGSPYPRARLERIFATPLDDAPSHLSMRARHRDKHLNENLAPLRRYLEAQVGRPWRCVYREISAHIRVTSAVQSHIKQHVRDFVVTSARFVDGELHGLTIAGGLRPLANPWSRKQFYVCPRSGLLKVVPRASVPRRRFGRVIVLDARHELREVDAVWQHVTLARRPARFQGGQLFDAVLGDWLDPTWFDERQRYASIFGRAATYAVSLRSPGVRERARIEASAPARRRM
ncbi:MAG: hypothetical protein WKG00_12920 [Polyangiaceae bacterium]